MDNARRFGMAQSGLTAVIPNIRVRTGILVTTIFLIAFVLRLTAVLILDSPPIDVSESGQTAANLITGRGYVFDFYGYRDEQPLESFMPPLYTGLIALCMVLVPKHPGFALNFFQIVLSSLTSLIFFGIGIELFDRRVALLAALGVALYPVFVVVSIQPTVTVVNTFLLGLLIWVLLRLRRQGTGVHAVLAGVILGLSALNRPLILIFFIPILGWLWLQRAELKMSWGHLSIGIALAASLTTAPWILRNVIIHEAPVLISTNGGFTFWNGNNPFTTGSGFDVYVDQVDAYLDNQLPGSPSDSGNPRIMIMEPYPLPPTIRDNLKTLSEFELDHAMYSASWKFIRTQPDRWLELTAAKLRALWWFRPNIGTYPDFYESAWITPYRMIYALLSILAMAGTYLTRRHWRQTVLLYLLFGTLTVGYVSFNVITRYRWEMEPFLILLASVSVSRLGESSVAKICWE